MPFFMLADPRGHENQVEKACEVKHNLRRRGDQGMSSTFFQCILKKRIDFYEMSRCIWTAGFYLTVFRWCWVTSTTGPSRRLNVVFETTTMCHRSENLRSSGNNWGLHILESHCPETGATQLIYWSSLELVIAFWNIVSEKCGPPDKNWKFCGQRR